MVCVCKCVVCVCVSVCVCVCYIVLICLFPETKSCQACFAGNTVSLVLGMPHTNSHGEKLREGLGSLLRHRPEW